MRPILLAAALALLGAPVLAAPACQIPAGLTPAPAYAPPAAQVSQAPTAAYLLALAWTPEWRRHQDEFAPAAKGDFGFTLHGLWPNGVGKNHPRYCAPAPALSAKTLRRHYCMTPSPALLQHEWAAHGTCGWTSPEAYFSQAAKLWSALKLPDLEKIPADKLTAGAVRAAFAKANRGLPASAVNIKVDGERRLQDVRLCYGLDFKFAPCPADGLGTPDEVVLRLTPRR